VKRTCVFVAAAVSVASSLSLAQGSVDPLTVHGLDQRTLSDIRARGMGGAVLAGTNRASILFANPAGLAGMGTMDLRVAGIGVTTSQRQTQEWVPNRLYTGLSLLMEDSWGDIKPPTDTSGNPIADPWEQLQKPFDAIGPNWSRSTNQALPLSVAFALPVQIGDVALVLGAGGARAIDLNHFFQNNNVTDPLLGRYRPQPIPELQVGDTLRARWFQSFRKRAGTIWGITPAIGMTIAGIGVGASATYYTGTSEDFEQRLDRGFLTFSNNKFRVQDTVHYASVRTGSSAYTGFGGTVGIRIAEPRFTVAATLQLPYTLNRKYSTAFQSREDVIIVRSLDSVQTTVVSSSESGMEKIHFPLAYSFGVVLTPFPRWDVAFDYEIRNLRQVKYTLTNGTVSQPWVGAPSFRLGAEYRWNDWLALRAGYREVTQSFAPEGSAIIGEPAVMSVYSAGAGLALFGMEIDVAYEYARLRYLDSWQSNVNYNTFTQHRLLLEIGTHLLGHTHGAIEE